MTNQGDIQGKAKDEKSVEVHVKNLKTNEKVNFKMIESATIAATWTQAYLELEEQRASDDEFQCADGDSLMNRLETTLAQLKDDGICKARKFEIRGPTGGAIRDRRSVDTAR